MLGLQQEELHVSSAAVMKPARLGFHCLLQAQPFIVIRTAGRAPVALVVAAKASAMEVGATEAVVETLLTVVVVVEEPPSVLVGSTLVVAHAAETGAKPVAAVVETLAGRAVVLDVRPLETSGVVVR